MKANRKERTGLGGILLGTLLALGTATGALAQTAPSTPFRASVSTPLRASASAPLKAGSCTPSANVLCLDNGRFAVAAAWRQSGGSTGVASVVAGSAADSGLFWFFAPTNYEMMVKVLDGCAVNGKHWVFFLATTDVGFTLTVTDTQTQQVKTYDNPPGAVSPVVTDTSAFPTCP